VVLWPAVTGCDIGEPEIEKLAGLTGIILSCSKSGNLDAFALSLAGCHIVGAADPML